MSKAWGLAVTLVIIFLIVFVAGKAWSKGAR